MKLTLEIIRYDSFWQCDIRSIDTGRGGASGNLGRGVGTTPSECVADALRVAMLTDKQFVKLFREN